jgi:hypothetical protein
MLIAKLNLFKLLSTLKFGISDIQKQNHKDIIVLKLIVFLYLQSFNLIFANHGSKEHRTTG